MFQHNCRPIAAQPSVSGVQAQLNIDGEVMRRTVAERAPDVLPRAAAARSAGEAWDAAMVADCLSTLPTCPDTALNPFPRGVNVTMEYGRYIYVEPEALASYYTNNFLKEMVECAADEDDCRDDTPPQVQVCVLQSLVLVVAQE